MSIRLDNALRRLSRRMGDPSYWPSLRKSDYDLLMDNLSKLDEDLRLQYVNRVLNWLSSNNGKQFKKTHAYFGLDLEYQIGYESNIHNTDGDILGVELKCQSISGNAPLRLTTKMGAEISNLIQEVIKKRCRKEIIEKYKEKSKIVYYGDAYSYHNNGSELNIEQRIEHGFIIQNGEVLKLGVENSLGRFKFDFEKSHLVICVKPEGYTRWIRERVGLNLSSLFSKFKNGFVYCLHYPREWKRKNVLLASFHVKLNALSIHTRIRTGVIGLEIRYGGGKRGKYESSGDAFQISRSNLENILFNSYLSKPLSNEYQIKKLF
ncbi:MAG: hypothetical protein VXZ89_06040 [Candidatus Thermoplasmatota archaeon]|nr:hypothetical protein [Candidatus Thermoplasmatota archaeon]